jgi:hypothetical protein
MTKITITPNEAADAISIRPDYVQAAVKSGALKSKQRRRVSYKDLIAWVRTWPLLDPQDCPPVGSKEWERM